MLRKLRQLLELIGQVLSLLRQFGGHGLLSPARWPTLRCLAILLGPLDLVLDVQIPLVLAEREFDWIRPPVLARHGFVLWP